MEAPPEFSRFREGEVFGRWRLKTVSVGELTVVSGRVVICDAFVDPDVAPLAAAVPSGRHPVTLFVAVAAKDSRVAAARVSFGSGAPVKWEQASSFGVDSGTAGMFDASLAARLLNDDALSDAVASRMNETYTHTWSWANVVVDEPSGANVIVFSSGFGDGGYNVWAEKDAEGRLVGFMADFDVVDVTETDPPAQVPKKWWQFWK